MSDLNQANIMGRLGKAPEVRYTQNGTAVATLSVATTEKYKDANGQQKEETEWHRVVFWGKRAETIGQYFKKGDPIYVTGKLKTREWTDQSGNKRYTTEIVGTDFIFPPGRSNRDGHQPPAQGGAGQFQHPPAQDGAGQFQQQAPSQASTVPNSPPPPPPLSDFDDDDSVPF